MQHTLRAPRNGASAKKSAIVIASLLLAEVAVASPATTYTQNIDDTYWGGLNNYSAVPGGGLPNKDVIADPGGRFDIFGAKVDRAGNNLTVTVYTNYVNNIGYLGTSLGNLFLGQGTTAFVGSGPHYETDTWTADNTRFDYAVKTDASGLYSVNAANIATSTGPGTAGWNYRGNQAYQTSNNSAVGGVVASSSIVTTGVYKTDANWTSDLSTTGHIIFTLTNLFNTVNLVDELGRFTFAWAMSCANDIIVATVTPTGGGGGEVPLPAAFPLFASGAGLLGFLGWRRKRKGAVSAA